MTTESTHGPGRLSVALATYNGERYLEEQLESYVSQTRLPSELVVRDDGSVDGTVALLQAFARRSPFPVKVIEGERNVGYAKNFEIAISQCTGDVVALSDQDDVWLPHKLEKLGSALLDEEAVLAFSDATVVDENLRAQGGRLWDTVRFGRPLQERTRRGGSNSPMFASTFVTGATCAFKRRLLSLASPFVLPYWHDAWLATLAAVLGRVVPIAEPLLLYRQHSSNALGAPALRPLWRRTVEATRQGSASARRVREDTERAYQLYSAVRTRIVDAGYSSPPVAAELDRRIDHARFRADLPPIPSRLVRALRELANGSYSRYSGGTRGFVRDMVR